MVNEPKAIIARRESGGQSGLARPMCPSCGRICDLGTSWPGANFCRGLTLLKWIEDTPNLSAAELAKVTGIPYKDVARGLLKLRHYNLLLTVPEDRTEGGYRYRYEYTGDLEARQDFMEALRRAESLNDN